MAVSIVLSGIGNSTESEKKSSKLFFVLCFIVFCLNGGVSITSKIHQLDINASRAVSAQGFVMLTAIIRAVVFSIFYLVLRLRDRKLQKEAQPARVKLKPSVLLIILASALVDGVSYLLQLIGAAHLPATVLYPLVTGGCVILTALCGHFFFREKLSRRSAIGIALCFISTLFFL